MSKGWRLYCQLLNALPIIVINTIVQYLFKGSGIIPNKWLLANSTASSTL